MFEKEAFNYGMTYAKTTLLNTNKELEQAYKDGAEFGYHEGFKDCAKSRLNVTTISDCPIKDDWHYPSKGELPTRDCMVLLHWESAIGSNTVITYWKKGKFLQPYNRKDITVAWQEIIPPKEIE